MERTSSRYNRILETMQTLAKEGKTQGERDAAKGRLAAIEKKMRANSTVSGIQIDFERLERLNREAEKRAEAERKWQAEVKRQEELIKQEELRKKEERKWKKRAKRKQKEAISRESKFEMRANWINSMLKDGIECGGN